MRERRAILAIASMMATLLFLLGGPAEAGKGGKADFSLFTTQTDDFVTCTATAEAQLHVTATNFDPDEQRINILFADGDLVTIMVPTGQSFSLTQVMGTNPGIDDVIRIDPLDNDGDVNPMVGWVSIHRVEGAAKVACAATPLP